jgi:alkylated DNA repair dioxygenase AlkB
MDQQLIEFDLTSVPQEQSVEQQSPSRNQEAIATISGLQYVENYIDERQHDWALARIDERQWLDDLKRRVQHYGFKYDYRARKVNHDMRIGELPEWLNRFSHKLYKDEHMPEVADQVIVNEYLPGQGISSHIDCEPCFKDTIISLSLGSGCVMNFTNKFDKKKKIPVWLEPRSLVVLSGEARDKWLHGIPARKSDVWEGQKHDRERRVSLTFRKVIIETAKR